ncbi:MAG: pyridoxamine 5'-phosphate oxidase family protein [Acidimicrobiia bacterium]|nr:pyridoxamine 5'-phosphate oxidase family protein [Acidimicrobiia bacterium]MBP8181642.1 pyridoxamine 5'-phosphate oxidase family protein [Acidimicrobiia bacterium]
MSELPRVERPDMEGYDVPDDLDGVLPWSWAQERLVANRNYWVVTANAGGRPHAMPVWGVWLPETDRFWFSCAESARKARNIAENPQCVVTVDDTIECVSVEGFGRIVNPVVEHAAVDGMIDAWIAKYGDDTSEPEQLRDFLAGNTVIEVRPDRAFGVIERPEDFSRRATRWNWS